MIGRTSGACRFNIGKFSEVLELRGMDKVISKRYDFIVDALFCFEPVPRFEYRVICSVLEGRGILVTARAREFCSNWRRNILIFLR